VARAARLALTERLSCRVHTDPVESSVRQQPSVLTAVTPYDSELQ